VVHVERDVVAESTTTVVRALKRRVDLGRMSSDDAVDVAIVQLMRPGGPRLADDEWARLRTSLSTRAKALAPPTTKALYVFAKEAAASAWALHHPGRSPSTSLRERAANGTVRSAAEAAVYAELMHARDDDDLVRRAVTRALGARRRGLAGRAVPLEAGDPLRAVLALPAQGRVRVPRGDVRGVIADAAVKTPALGGLLREVAAFSRDALEDALGDELWSLCRPVGFSDRQRTRVLIVTTSSVAAQEAQLRSRELHHRLRHVPGLERIVGVKVAVDAAAFARVLGAT